ncbi:MAG: pyridoxal-phosphate dependent enzyme, partial [Bacteroidetes bacterium]
MSTDFAGTVATAATRIAPHILKTPLEYSPWLSRETGAEVWLKMEHLQITGSFKLRGAANKLLSLDAAQRAAGVVTASTGNHGAAVAHIAAQTGVPATIYLPRTVQPAKVAYLSLFEVELVYVGEDSVEAEAAARLAAAQSGRVFVSPYNDAEVIAGQGTLGREILQQLPEVEAVWVPVGGGGL